MCLFNDSLFNLENTFSLSKAEYNYLLLIEELVDIFQIAYFFTSIEQQILKIVHYMYVLTRASQATFPVLKMMFFK